MGRLPTVKVRVKDELSTQVEVNICTHVQCVKYIITSKVRVLMFMRVTHVPVVARPPACSMMKANGMHSYRSLSLPRGAALVPGYMKIPPYWGAEMY